MKRFGVQLYQHRRNLQTIVLEVRTGFKIDGLSVVFLQLSSPLDRELYQPNVMRLHDERLLHLAAEDFGSWDSVGRDTRGVGLSRRGIRLVLTDEWLTVGTLKGDSELVQGIRAQDTVFPQGSGLVNHHPVDERRLLPLTLAQIGLES